MVFGSPCIDGVVDNNSDCMDGNDVTVLTAESNDNDEIVIRNRIDTTIEYYTPSNILKKQEEEVCAQHSGHAHRHDNVIPCRRKQ